VKNIMGSYTRVCCGYVTCAQHGVQVGVSTTWRVWVPVYGQDAGCVDVCIWPVVPRVCVCDVASRVPLGAVPVAASAGEEARSSPPPNGVLRIGSSLCVCVCVCSHRRVSWPWAPTEVALSPKLTPLACPFVLLSVCARLARCPYPRKL